MARHISFLYRNNRIAAIAIIAIITYLKNLSFNILTILVPASNPAAIIGSIIKAVKAIFKVRFFQTKTCKGTLARLRIRKNQADVPIKPFFLKPLDKR